MSNKYYFSSTKLSSCIIEYYLSYIEGIKIFKHTEPTVVGWLLHKGMELYIKDKYKLYNDNDITIEDFIKRIKSKDVDELGYLMSNYNNLNIYKDEFGIINGTSDEELFNNRNQIIKQIKELNINNIIKKYDLLFDKTKNYINSILSKNINKEIVPEVLLKRDFSNILFYGILDLYVLTNDNKILVIDYKTSKNKSNKFQIYFYGYLASDTEYDNISLFYIYPSIDEISHVNIDKNILNIKFEPYIVNRAKSLINIKNILNLNNNKVIVDEELISIISNNKYNYYDLKNKIISYNNEFNRIYDNIDILSALNNDFKFIISYNQNNYKCGFCNFKNICTFRNYYSKIIS